MENLPDQHLNISLWIPLGVNNILDLSEKIDLYLRENRESLNYISWNGNIEVNDSSLKFMLYFNSPYDNCPESLILEAHFYGCGFIRFCLYPKNDTFKDKTPDPKIVNKSMRFLIEKSRNIVVGTLLEHQYNYLSRILFGNGILSRIRFGNGIISAEEYLSASKNNKLDNGIMDEASDDDIKMGLRFEKKEFIEKISNMDKKEKDLLVKTIVLKRTVASQIPTEHEIDVGKCIENIDVNKYREKDLLVKTIVLKRTATSQIPTAYDDTDGDFDNYMEMKTECINGKHRSSLLTYEESKPISESIICQISGYNSLIRFQLLFISILKFVRNEISLVRLGLLRRRGFKFAKNVPEYILNAEQMTIQGYVFYLISRMPLLEEIEKNLEEAQNRLKILSSTTSISVNSEDPSNDTTTTIHQLKAYNDNLTLATSRILEGLIHEVESVKNLIEIHDGESLLNVSTEIKSQLEEMRKMQGEVKQFAQEQTTMQKRSLETQFAQSEFARSGEVRMRVGRTTTQIAGALAVAGFLTTQVNNLLTSLTVIPEVKKFGTIVTKIIGLNISNVLIPLSMAIFGWILVGKYLSRTQKFGDIVEVIMPLNCELFDEIRLFDENENSENKTKLKIRLHRLRVEGNMYRVTWEDKITVSHALVSILNSIRKYIYKEQSTERNISKKVIVTLEYIKDQEKAELKCITLSIEKSQVDNEDMKRLQTDLRTLAKKRLHELTDISEKEWDRKLESNGF